MSRTTVEHRGREILGEYLRWAHQRGEGVTDAEMHAVLGPAAFPAVIRGTLRQRQELAACRLVTEPTEEIPGRVVAEAVTADGTRMRASVVIRPDGNAYAMIVKALPEGFALREAVAADGPRLAEVCRSAAIVTVPRRTTVDYGPDYLRATEVAEPRIVLLIESNGRIVALHGCVVHEAVIGDRRETLSYLRHTRIDPAVQGVGLFSALNGALFERGFAAGGTAYSLVAVGNDRMQEKLPEELRRWPWRHKRFYLDTRALAGHGPLGEVDPVDAAALIARLCEGTAITLPVTPATLHRRLDATPYRYGPDRLLGDGGAVVGVSRASIQMTTESPDGIERRREVVAFDVGAEDADALERVLRSWCHRLAAEGIDDLVVDTTTASPVHDRLASLARLAREFALQMSYSPSPGVTGFRVDPAYI